MQTKKLDSYCLYADLQLDSYCIYADLQTGFILPICRLTNWILIAYMQTNNLDSYCIYEGLETGLLLQTNKKSIKFPFTPRL